MNRDDERRKIAKAFTKAMASADLRSVLCNQGESGPSILVALPDDTMGTVFERLKDYDNCANLIVPDRESFTIALFYRGEVEGYASPRRDDDDCPIHEDSEVSMFIAYLEEVRRPISCHLAAPNCNVELIDQGRPELLTV